MKGRKHDIVKARLILLCYFTCAICYLVSLLIKRIDGPLYENYAYYVLFYFERFSTYLWISLMAFHTRLCIVTKIATLGVLLAFLSDLIIVSFRLEYDYVEYVTTPILVISFLSIILIQLKKWVAI